MTPVPMEPEAAVLALEGREVRVTHPDKLYFSRQARLTKLDLVRYFLSIAPGALAGIRDRPLVLKRFVDGAEGAPFYQKRAPSARPEWLRTVTLAFPSGRTAEELVVDDAAGLAFVVNLGCIELHPHPVRTGNLDHPDELRIDLDPTPGVAWADLRRVAVEVRALLEEVGLRGWPKTSGSRGMHVYARIWPRWTFTEVRRAALAFSREIERRMPNLATSKWWKEERRGVFLDYNQNAKDRTTCSAYSVRPLPDARVSAPLAWDEVADCEPADFTVSTMPGRSLRSAIRMPASTPLRARWRSCSNTPRATRRTASVMRPGRRTFARWKERGCALRHRARKEQHENRARRCRSSSLPTRPTRRPRSRGSNGGRVATRRPPGTSLSMRCWSILCAAGSRPGRGFA